MLSSSKAAPNPSIERTHPASRAPPLISNVRRLMDRIAASLVRWGAGLSFVVPIGYFVSLRSFDDVPGSDVGLGIGLTVIAVVTLIVLSALVVVGAIRLWYAALVNKNAENSRYENERAVGAVWVIIAAAITVFLL
jgi:hypothetical protein